MPSIEIPKQIFTVSSVSTGILTVTASSSSANTANLYAGMIGNLVGPGGTPSPIRVKIQTVISPGVIRCKVVSFSGTGVAGTGEDFSSYETGTLYFEKQLAGVSDLYIPDNSGLEAIGLRSGSILSLADAYDLSESKQLIEPATSLDLDVNCDSEGGFIWVFNGFTVTGAAHSIKFSINTVVDTNFRGLRADGNMVNTASASDADGSQLCIANGQNGIINSQFGFIVRCDNPYSLIGFPRIIEFVAWANYNPTGGSAGKALNKGSFIFNGTEEIAKIGVLSSVELGISGLSFYSLSRPALK